MLKNGSMVNFMFCVYQNKKCEKKYYIHSEHKRQMKTEIIVELMTKELAQPSNCLFTQNSARHILRVLKA
jgi:hypothetical protein